MTRPALSDPAVLTQERSVWFQHWFDVLFLHWRVPADLLRLHVPAELAIDEHNGEGWVSLVLFKLRVRPAWLPFLPGLSNLVEVNLRTYVRFQDQPGITFLSVHADNRLAMFLARRLTPMPYQWASMDYEKSGPDFHFKSADGSADGFRLAVDFRPAGEADTACANMLDEWLLERYRLFLPDGWGRLLFADVSHPRWQVQQVDVSMSVNSAGDRFELELARTADLAHFSEGVHAHFGSFRKVDQ